MTNGIHLHRVDFGYIPLVKTFPKIEKLTFSHAESAFLNDGDLCSTSLIVAEWTIATQLIKVAFLEDLTINSQHGILNPQVGDPSTRAIFELQNLSLKDCSRGQPHTIPFISRERLVEILLF